MDTKNEELLLAYKRNRRTPIGYRLHAICMIEINGRSVADTAREFFVSYQSVQNWLDAYKKDGAKGLEDRPRSGRPTFVSKETIESILNDTEKITPKTLMQQIYENTGVKYHIGHVTKILHQLKYSRKTPQIIHIQKSDKEEIEKFQHGVGPQISRLENLGYIVVVIDESFFIYDVIPGQKYWSPINKRILLPYTGRHDVVTMFGGITTDGRHFFRSAEKFNSKTSIRFIGDLHNHFGKTAVIADRATPHKSKALMEFIKKNPGIRMIYLPKGCPEFNPMEEWWRQAKHDLMVSEYYRTFDEMKYALCEYFRTKKYSLDVMKYFMRVMPVSNYLCV